MKAAVPRERMHDPSLRFFVRLPPGSLFGNARTYFVKPQASALKLVLMGEGGDRQSFRQPAQENYLRQCDGLGSL
jgi:hypothetical protein